MCKVLCLIAPHLKRQYFTANRISIHTYLKKDSPQKAMLENFFDQSGITLNTSFYNRDGGHDLNMQTQKIAFLS